jgi:hypothetical protein
MLMYPATVVAKRSRARPLSGLGGAAVKGAAAGASTGATVGSAVPVIGTAIGAVVGAVVGALASILSKKDRDKIAWGQYLSGAGKAPGRAYDELPFELAWQGMQEKYAPWKQWQVRQGDSGYELGLVDLIVRGAREGKLTTTSTVNDAANYVFGQLEAFKPGFQSFLNNQGVRQIHLDFVDRAIAGLPVGATYRNKRQPHTTLVEELSKGGVQVKSTESTAPIATTVTVPVATPSAPSAPAPIVTVPTPVVSTPAAVAPPTSSSSTPTTSITPAAADNTRAIIDALLQQGASSQQAFAGAMQSLAAQGVQPTPQIQQAVAEEVKSKSASTLPGWIIPAAGALGLTALMAFLLFRRPRK